MNTLIVYASKTGTTKKCASLLAANLGAENCTLFDISSGTPDCSGFDFVAVGTYIRMGMADKKISAFLKTLAENPDSPRFGIFICCCIADKVSESITKNFCDDLLEKAECVECFGGEMVLEKQKGLDKFIVNSLMKIAKNDPSFSVDSSVSPEKITEFAEEIMK